MAKRSSFGWIELILGILLIAAGIFTLSDPGRTLITVAVLYGILAIITGIADIVIYFRVKRRTGLGSGLTVFSGLLSIVVGVLFLINVSTGVFVLAYLFAFWFIVHCVNRLANLNIVREIAGNGIYWLTLIFNVIGLILGVIMLFNPVLTASTLAFLIAFYLILGGISSIAWAFSKMGE